MDDGAVQYQRFLDGDEIGLRALIDLYYDGLALYLNTYLRNLSAAEELAEDVFVLLATRRPAFGGRSGFKTWLYAIGRHRAVDRLRRSRHAPLPIDACETVIADDLDVEKHYIQDEEKRAVHGAMSRLKADYRQALWLVYFEDMSQQEVAQVMERSVGSVEHLLRRARAALRSEMQKEGFTYERS